MPVTMMIVYYLLSLILLFTQSSMSLPSSIKETQKQTDQEHWHFHQPLITSDFDQLDIYAARDALGDDIYTLASDFPVEEYWHHEDILEIDPTTPLISFPPAETSTTSECSSVRTTYSYGSHSSATSSHREAEGTIPARSNLADLRLNSSNMMMWTANNYAIVMSLRRQKRLTSQQGDRRSA